MTSLSLDAVQTVTVAALALYAGYGVLRLLPVLGRHNVPAAVLGGLVVAALLALGRGAELPVVDFDTTLQSPLMTAFFTSIGLAASVGLLRAGGVQVIVFLALAAVLAVVQGAVGVGIAVAFDLVPAAGVLMGPAALAGGPATSLAFAPTFEAAGVDGAATLAVAAAMAGIVLGGLIGGPVATALLRRRRVAPRADEIADGRAPAADDGRGDGDGDGGRETSGPVGDTLRGLAVVLVAMGLGAGVGAALDGVGVTLPGYVGAMLVGAVARNLDDATGWLKLPHATIARIGVVSLTLFLSMALMNLRLWELAALALPLLVNLVVQSALVAGFALLVVYRAMGRDYDAAVMAGGFVGFMLGTTANAMAVMRTLADRYGPAPRAFLVAPLVGAFFIDFTNALIITSFLNVLKPTG